MQTFGIVEAEAFVWLSGSYSRAFQRTADFLKENRVGGYFLLDFLPLIRVLPQPILLSTMKWNEAKSIALTG